MEREGMKQMIVILDFGSQYSQLIARRIREANVYCEIVPFNVNPEEIRKKNPEGIILSGGPASIYVENAPCCEKGVWDVGAPVLGICYGMQITAQHLGGQVATAEKGEYGKIEITVDNTSPLFQGIDPHFVCWMSHRDSVAVPPEGFKVVAKSSNTPVAAMENQEKKMYCLQFHPEVVHTVFGKEVIQNFLFNICGCQADWTPASFIEENIKQIRAKVGDGKVLCALSGGVDSSVAAVLVHKAIGDQLTCVFVDNGLMRKGEPEQVEKTFREHYHINLIHYKGEERFLAKLAGVEDPEAKRKVIGEEFIRIFEDEARKLGKIDYLVQGTLYPDVIESISTGGPSACIKSHHNVGGLPEDMQFELIEPLRQLFKDEVRAVGRELGLPDEIVDRQPFPGPGLAIRLIGQIDKEKLDILREADAIVQEEVKVAGLYKELWQSFAILVTNTKSVGVMGDERTYDYLVAVRAVTSDDGMTADWAKLPYEVLEKISSRIINEVRGVNRVAYDISSKPPATIEWE